MRADAGAVVVCAGDGLRMGGVDKALLPVRGRAVLLHSLDLFESAPRVASVVVVLSERNLEASRELIRAEGFKKVVATVRGGERRQDSVRQGLEALAAHGGEGLRWVLVHDGARPLARGDLIERGLEAVTRTGAAAPGVPVSDTVKRVDASGLVEDTPSRAALRAVQTPQVFGIDVLRSAYQAVNGDVTDDAAAVEAMGGDVVVFEGDPENIKLTEPEDIQRVEAILARRAGEGPPAGPRWGTGFDGHRLVAGGPLRLGGVDVEFDQRLEGHSDGDVLLHACASACLGAAGLGDLGSRFPSSDPALAGIDSRELLRRVASLVNGAGWVVEHLDATIIAQRPKLAPYVERMGESIASALGVQADSISIKITSTDRVGAIGAGEGIAAQAVATLGRRAST
ncbi:MAG: 2-C-methyl-D-erythritol 4-phosphate cytidylyltransferase [Dehalococcoidia bacterium]